MAQIGIKRITFASVGRNEGCLCDKCGTYIRNIVTVDYTDGIRMNYGQDCFGKMYKAGKLTEQGKKLLQKALKDIKRYSDELEMWKTITEAEAEEKGLLECLKPDTMWKTYWCGKTFEEYKAWMISDWYPARFEECQKVVDRFSKCHFENIR